MDEEKIVSEASIEVNGAAAPYITAGDDGPAVVMAHGGTGDRRDWTRNIPALARHHRVYAPDLVGYGHGPRLDGPYTLHRFSDFLLDFIDASNLGRVTLIGHSLGGRACLEVARQAPDRVASLVLVAPIGFGSLSPIGFAIGASAWAATKMVRRALPYPPLDLKLHEADLGGFGRTHPPTLVLWGRWDLFFPWRYGRRAAEVIPNARLKVFNLSGHSPHKDQPSAFNGTILDFLRPARE